MGDTQNQLEQGIETGNINWYVQEKWRNWVTVAVEIRAQEKPEKQLFSRSLITVYKPPLEAEL